MLDIAIIGCGQRGRDVYGELFKKSFPNKVNVKGIAEPKKDVRDYMKKYHGISDEYIFNDWKDLLEKEKFCDALIIGTNDDMHFEPFKMAMEKGYHMILEKPMTNSEEELLKMEKIAKLYPENIVMVGHVLRYSPFFNIIKNKIDTRKIGDVVSIQHAENIGFYHMAHSFVRGNWRNSKETSPIILAKSCHDMDILLYLMDSKCTKISSFGSLKYFNKENKPVSAGERCLNCKIERRCPYSAKRLYLNNIGRWPSTVISFKQDRTNIIKALENTDYGLCVHNCPNDVMDNQVTIMQFENGASATFQLTAFTHEVSRTIKVMGTHGEIIGDMESNQIKVYDFTTGKVDFIDVSKDSSSLKGHGGGDEKLINDFVEIVLNKLAGLDNFEGKTSLLKSIESHKMAFKAEKSRLSNSVEILE